MVTAKNKEDTPIGITANSFASVSLEPPLVSWCVDKDSTRYTELLDAEFYTISVLGESQQELSDLFAYRSWDDQVFDDVVWYEGENQVPQLEGVNARFHCRQVEQFDAGDHVIIIGAVEKYEHTKQKPLVFFQGDYKSLI